MLGTIWNFWKVWIPPTLLRITNNETLYFEQHTVLYSKSSRAIYPKHNSVYMPIPKCYLCSTLCNNLDGRRILKRISSVQFSCLVVSDSLWPHESQHARPPCPSPTPRVHSDSVHWVSDAIQPSHPLSSPSPKLTIDILII